MPPPGFSSHGTSISGDLYFPSTGSPWPSIVIAHGTEGLDPPFNVLIRDFGKALAAAGFLAFVPRYFESTGTPAGFPSVFSPIKATERFDRWVQVLQDSIGYVQGIAGDTAGRSGFVGFSLGSHLVLRAAAGPSVKAVVDFFGPLATVGSAISPAIIKHLPPTLIHHGKLDEVVRPAQSDTLAKWLVADSIHCSYNPHAYPADGHPGQSLIPSLTSADWSAASQASATTETVAFLLAHV